MRRLVPLVMLCACARSRDPAPEDVDGLSRWLFEHWEDPALLAEGMGNLAPWLAAEAAAEEPSDGYVLSDFTTEEVAGVPHPDRDLAAMIGVAVPAPSPFPVLDHAGLIVLEDQTWNDTRTYEVYTRSIAEGDADAFAAGSGMVRTVNDIDKNGAFGVHIPYTLFKDFTWVELDLLGRAVVARSWIEETSCAEGGNNCLYQSFSVDLWYGPDDATTIRMTASWNELVTSADSVLSDDERIGLMVNGIHDIFANTDELLAGEE